MQKTNKPCPKCGQPMHRRSKQCRDCYIQEKVANSQYVQRICLWCSKEFTTHIGQIEAGYGFYCSRQCARKGSPTKKRNRQKTWCAYCGKVFDKHKSEIKRNIGNKHFCSQECWYAFNKGEKHYGWEGGQDKRNNPHSIEWRKAIVRREQGHCRLCLDTEKPVAHHIKKFSTHPDIRWEVSNGILLCKRCHDVITGNEQEMEQILYILGNLPHRIVNSYAEFCESIATLGVPDDFNEKKEYTNPSA